MSASLRSVTLEDKYALAEGTVLLSGTQALVRLPLLQHALDVSRGFRTAGYISGYRGSPLGGLDQQLWRAKHYLDAAGIVFEPGVNEDLAATAIWGTQQVPLLPGAKVEGVFALWYGKGPGLDRSGDPIKHGNRMGASVRGGVLLAVGDDHTGKSSTVAYQSEQALAANGLPVLYPASVQEYLDLGLLGWALSRYSGLWVGFKCVNDTVETTATVEVGHNRFPTPYGLPPPADVNARIAFNPIGDDERLQRLKLPAALQFARAFRLDREVLGVAAPRLGLIAAGKSYSDSLAALSLLGINLKRARELGIGLFKPAMVWPLEPQALRNFARGSIELFVIEEKAAFIEPQVAHELFNLESRARPRLSGKYDVDGRPLLPSDVALRVSDIAMAIASRIAALGISDPQIDERVRDITARSSREAQRALSPVKRAPYFCSGCPHNTSTRIPEGSLALSGIGCHTMAMGMDRRTLPPTQMGGEGMTWAGIAPFTTLSHVFQNLGDGTYFHSGLLAIRAAVNARVNITYKLLVNDAVAMTGGQPVEGNLGIAEMSRQLAAERVGRIAVVSDNPRQWRAKASAFTPGVTFHDRAELDAVQREFREIVGVSAIIYEQTCAAEKRRRRKRGAMTDPSQRIFINSAVCEGCGDCSVKSNCLSVEPLETELGRKRRIEQSSCNKDYSCVKGFCPSFVVVENASIRKVRRESLALESLGSMPPSPPRETRPFNALIAGVGGTGVVTVGAVLAMAAHLEGRAVAVFDMTGLAQKGGAVLSHLQIMSFGDAPGPAALPAGSADLLLGCDLVVAAASEALETVDADRTQIVINGCTTPVSQFQRERDYDFHNVELMQRTKDAVAEKNFFEIPATEVAEALLGDAIATNMLMLGFAYQGGALPVCADAISRAIQLNGTAVALNLSAFELGRHLRHDPARVLDLLAPAVVKPSVTHVLESLIARRVEMLTAYQDRRYARRYEMLIETVREAERRAGGDDLLAEAVARNYYKLLAYKDEYEVARLYSTEIFKTELERVFEGNIRMRILLAPPLFTRKDPVTGEPRKIAFGPWILPAMRLLAKGRRLRGTVFDPFGYLADRRMERNLIAEYEKTIELVIARLSAQNLAAAVRIAALPDSIRGFGHIKARTVEIVREQCRRLLAAYAEDGVA